MENQDVTENTDNIENAENTENTEVLGHDEDLEMAPMPKDTKKSFGSGVGLGVFIGFMVATILCTVVFSLLIVFRLRTIVSQQNQVVTPGSELVLGQSVTDKMNSLLSLIDFYYLYDYSKEEIEEKIYDGIMEALNDPYSVYYTPKEYKDMMEETDGSYGGIGVVVSKNQETGEVMVVNPYANCPGAEAGLMVDDIILSADGIELADLDLDQAVSHIRGEENTQVVLTIRRGTEVFDVTCTRRIVDIVTVDAHMAEGNVGIITVSQFDGVTKDQFIKAFEDLKSQGMKGVVIDLRGNPGGRLDVVANMCDYLLPEGLIVYTKDKNGNVQNLNSDKASALDIPCVVLMDGNSASASEIFGGAMQDYEAATIMGTQSYGKGIVQTIIRLKDNSAVKITVEDYFTPNGHNIHGIGITPDVVVEFDRDAYLADGTDNQLDAAIDHILKQIQ